MPAKNVNEKLSGNAIYKLRQHFGKHIKTGTVDCLRCGKPIEPGQPWDVDHIIAQSVDMSLSRDRDNMHPSHRTCNRRHGAAIRSLKYGFKSNLDVDYSDTAPASRINEDIDWSNLIEGAQLIENPDGAKPRLFSPPHPDAQGTYWADVEEPLKDLYGRMKWPWLWAWQSAVLERLWEYDDEGEMCWQRVLVSAPRGSGKSWIIRPIGMARVFLPDLFGCENGQIFHLARRLDSASAVNLAVQESIRRAHPPIEVERLYKGMGHWSINSTDGGFWEVGSLASAYSKHQRLPVIDECWDLDNTEVNEAIVPTAVHTHRGHVIAFSTRHKDETPLIALWRRDAARDDTDVMLAEWSTEAGSDPYDIATYRDSSPHWSKRREKQIQSMIVNETEINVLLPQWANTPVTEGPTKTEWPRGWSKLPEGDPAGPYDVVGVEQAWDRSGWSAVFLRTDTAGIVHIHTETAYSSAGINELLRMWAGEEAPIFAGLTTLAELGAVIQGRDIRGAGGREITMTSGLAAALTANNKIIREQTEALDTETRHAEVSIVEGGLKLSQRRTGKPIPHLHGLLFALHGSEIISHQPTAEIW